MIPEDELEKLSGPPRWFLMGLIVMALPFIGLWVGAETECEKEYNVYDCEWSQSPFAPIY